MKPTARRRLGKYVLLGRLGHGGMGKIYLAYAPGPVGIEKLLVVKRLHSHLTGDPLLVNSFLDEARLSMALNHPHIVNTFDVGEVEGRYFMVMEYIDGQNLGVVLRTAKRSGAYPGSAVWGGLFLHVLDALHAAHVARDARGRPLHIIHRDVSPQNILITYDGLPKLVDFGIAKAAMRVSETDAGVLKGKYAYMSPEQVRGEGLDPRSDVFAAGIVLWEMLAGRRLYKADTIVRSVERILTEPPISPVRVNAECDPEIAKVAVKALQKDRGDRFSSALEFKEALEEAMRAGNLRARQNDVRELMQRLFADVIVRQRAAIEQCLNQADAGAPIAIADDEEPVDSRSGKSDSESDLNLQHLKDERDAGENTTPSVHRSPLVTQDGERAGIEGATSLERKKTKGKRGLVMDAAAAPEEPPPQLSISPVEITQTQSNVPARRWFAPLLMGALGIVIVGAAVVAILIVDTDDPGAISASRRAAAPALKAPLESPTSPPQPDVAPSPPMPVPTGEAPKEKDASPPSDAVPPSAGDADSARSSSALSPDTKRRGLPRAGAKKVDKPKELAKDDEEQPQQPASGEMGTLSLDTVPWTTVYLGKKKLGETPLVNVPVPAGTLELLLVNAEAGIREGYIAKVKPGQAYKARLVELGG